MKDSGKVRQQRKQRKGDKETEFWRQSRVGMVQEIFPVNSQSKYIIPN